MRYEAKNNKKIVCGFLAICMVVGLLAAMPMTASAAVRPTYSGDYEILNYLPYSLTPQYPVPAYVINESISDVEKEMNGVDFQALHATTMALIAGKTTDYQKAQAIASWVASNISYDYSYSLPSDPLSVYKNKSGVCEGYSNLTYAMLYIAGIPCVNISGMPDPSRTLQYAAHAWNAALIDGSWVFMDTTWGDFDIPTATTKAPAPLSTTRTSASWRPPYSGDITFGLSMKRNCSAITKPTATIR